MIDDGDTRHAGKTLGEITQQVERSMHQRDQPESDPQDENDLFDARHGNDYDQFSSHVSTNYTDMEVGGNQSWYSRV